MKKLNLLFVSIFLILIFAIIVYANPTVNLLSLNETYNTSHNMNEDIIFTCSATDNINLKNSTLHIWDSSGGLETYFKSVMGLEDTSSWNIGPMSADTYKWNCLYYNNQSNYSWAPLNYTLNITNYNYSNNSISEEINSSTDIEDVNVSSEINISVNSSINYSLDLDMIEEQEVIVASSQVFEKIEPNKLSISGLSFPSESSISISTQVNEKLQTEEKVKVIIILKDPKSIDDWKSEVSSMNKNEISLLEKDMRNTVIQDLSNTKHLFNSFNGFSAEITEEELDELIDSNLVKKVEYDEPVHVTLQDSVPLINATLTWNLQDDNGVNLTGAGQTVCVIDSGVDYTHSDLGGCTNFVFNTSSTRDESIISTNYPSNYPNYDGSYLMGAVNYSGYDGISLYFDDLDVQDGIDAVGILDKDDVVLTWYTGNNVGSFWTEIFYEDLIKIIIYADDTINRTGFNISQSKGYNFTHNSSCSKVIDGYDFTNGDPNPMDDFGHGTHCAGIIAANGNIKGVAPDARIVAVKALDNTGSGWSSDIIAGIEYCNDLSEELNISVISMSLGGSVNYSNYCDTNSSGYSLAISNSFDKNISVIVATGNNYNHNAISAPACIEKAIPVTATDKNDDMASFAQRTSLVKLTGPGVSINSTKQDGSCLIGCACSGDYMICGGTSMATPHVAGAFAIYNQELASFGESMTPWEIENEFDMSGVPINDTTESGETFSRIDIFEALSEDEENFDNASIIKTTLTPSVIEGNIAEFLINVTNTGNINLTNLEVRDEWNSSFINYTSFYTSNNYVSFYDPIYNESEIFWYVNLTPGQNVEIYVNFTTLNSGNTTNFVDVEKNASVNYDNDYANLEITSNSTSATPISVGIIYPTNSTIVTSSQQFTLNYSINLDANCTAYMWNSTGDEIFSASIQESVGSGYKWANVNQYLANAEYEWNVYCYEIGNESNNAWGNSTNNISFEFFGPDVNLDIIVLNDQEFSLGDTIMYMYNITNTGSSNLTSLIIETEFNQGEVTLNYTGEQNCDELNFTNGANGTVNLNGTALLLSRYPGGLPSGYSFIVLFNLTIIFDEGGAHINVNVEGNDVNGQNIHAFDNIQVNILMLQDWDDGLNDWQSSIVSPYIPKDSSKLVNFSLLRQAGDDACMQNLTIKLPNDNFTFNGDNSSSINSAKYTFVENGNELTWIATGNDFFCGEGPEYFSLNITSVNGYKSSTFEVSGYSAVDSSYSAINLTLFTTSQFNYNGTVYDLNAQEIENASVSLTVLSFSRNGDVNLGTFTAYTNSNGVFDILNVPGLNASEDSDMVKVSGDSNLFYRLSAAKYNDSNDHYALYVGPSMPELPEIEIISDFGLADPDIYLKPAVSLHIQVEGRDYKSGVSNNSLCNQSGCPDDAFNWTNIGFSYGIKDKKLGFEVTSDHSSRSVEQYIAAPLNRNYSLMVFPEAGFPLYVDIENITTRCNLTGYNLSTDGVDASCTITNGTYLVDIIISSQQNITTFTGSINENDVDSFKIVAYMMGGGDMIFDQDTLPFNMGQMMRWPKNNTLYDDQYDLVSGNYSIYLPATDASSTIMLMAFAKKSGNYYYSSHKLSASGLSFQGGNTYDFNLSNLFEGTDLTINSNNISEDWNETTIINTKGIKFNLVNDNGSLLENEDAFIDIKLEDNDVEYMRMTNAANGYFALPLTQGSSIKKLTIYAQSYSPISTPISSDVLLGNENTSTIECDEGICNVTLSEFGDFDPFGEKASLRIDFYKSDEACDVPNPAYSCSYTSGQGTNKSSFSPMKMILLGDISLRMTRGNLSVHYMNTDLLASGPPDAMFETNNSGTDMQAAWKFGSQGPEIYQSVLLSVPYGAALENQNITIDIPLLYDNEFNVLWNMSKGENITTIQNNPELEDYLDYLGNEYESYLNGTGVFCNETDENLTNNLCYRDTDANLLWMKIPHFSGVGPRVTGTGNSTPEGNLSFVISKTSDYSSYDYGDMIEYEINITNTGDTNFSFVNVNDTFVSSELSYTASTVTENSAVSEGVYWYNLTQGSIVTPGNTFSYNVNMTTTEIGHITNTINISVTDRYGNSNSAVANVTVYVNDSIPPTTPELLSPVNGYNSTSSTLNLTFNVSDIVDTVLSCDLLIDSVFNKTVNATSNAITVTYISSLTDGLHNWTINCSDNSGNANISETRDFRVDTMPPVVSQEIINWTNVNNSNFSSSLTSYTNISLPLEITSSTGNVTLTWNVNDSNLVFQYLYIDNIIKQNSTSIGDKNKNLLLSAGKHKLRFTAMDIVGEEDIKTYYVRINRLENITQLQNSIKTSNAGKITNVSILQNGSLLNETDYLNKTLSLEMNINISGNNTRVDIIDFDGLNANWNRTDFGTNTNSSSSEADQIINNSGTNVTSLILFNNVSQFLNESDFDNGVKIFFDEPLSGRDILFIADDVGNDVYIVRRICENNSTEPTSFPVTTTNMCYYNTSTNITIWIPHLSGTALANDTVAPGITVNTPTQGSTQTNSYFTYNITISEANPVTSETFCSYMFNRTGTVVNLELDNFTNISGQPKYNFEVRLTEVENGDYSIQTNCSDENGRNSSVTKIFMVNDNVAPNVTYSSSPSNNSATITITSLYSYDKVNYTIIYGTSNTSLSSTKSSATFDDSHSINLSSLNDDKTYYYNITACDINNNCAESGTLSFTTDTDNDIDNDDSESEGDGSAGGTGGYWTTTYAAESEDIYDLGFTKAMGLKKRIKLKIGTEYHYVGIVGITSLIATINVSSTSQQAIFRIGETKVFNVNDDEFYDIKVTLNTIENSIATITVTRIHEEISPSSTTESNNNSTNTSNTTTIEPRITESNNTTTSTTNTSLINNSLNENEDNVNKFPIWTLIIIIVLFLASVGIFVYMKFFRYK